MTDRKIEARKGKWLMQSCLACPQVHQGDGWSRGSLSGPMRKGMVDCRKEESEGLDPHDSMECFAHPKTFHLADFLCGKQDMCCDLLSGGCVVLWLLLAFT